jgi:hypothetical protein
MSGPCPSHASPFDLDHEPAYQHWRAHKLQHYPTTLEEITVPIADPFAITAAERQALLACCSRANMALYRTASDTDPDKRIPYAILASLVGSPLNIDCNEGADAGGVTSITVVENGPSSHYIPYRPEPIQWHTDGYYNTTEEQIYSLILHCVHPSARGGSNGLLDHELAYIHLRDQNRHWITALMHPEAMTIPARVEQGVTVRPARSGPVFSVTPAGQWLHMRYTARLRNIQWRTDPVTTEAVAALRRLPDELASRILRGTLAPGWGLVCRNILHDRAPFQEDPALPGRLLYRIRCFDRIA